MNLACTTACVGVFSKLVGAKNVLTRIVKCNENPHGGVAKMKNKFIKG